MSEFLKKLTAAIEKKGISKSKLSEESGVSRMQIYRILNGENVPNLDICLRLASAAGIKKLTLSTESTAATAPAA